MVICMDLQELRERAGLSPEQVAVALSKAYSTIKAWERGRYVPTLSPGETQKLLGLYGCSLEELNQAAIESKAKFDRGDRS